MSRGEFRMGPRSAKCGRPAQRYPLALLVAFLLAALPATARADTEIGTQGTGAGQTSDPTGVAVDQTSELLYVADTKNNRVSVFDAQSGEFVRAFGWGVEDGTSEELQACTATCFQGLPGAGAGQLDNVTGIAVDNDPGSAGYHDVYVFDRNNHRVQKFTPAGAFVWMIGGEVNQTTGEGLCTQESGDTCGAGVAGSSDGQFNNPGYGAGVAVGPGGTVHVHDRIGFGATAETRVQKYEPSGASAGKLELAVSGGSGNAAATAVDSEGKLYLGTTGGTGALRVYDSGGTELFAVNPSFNLTSVALDSVSGNFWVGDRSSQEGVLISHVSEYDSAGTLLRIFYGDDLVGRSLGLAPFSNGVDDLFVGEQNTVSPVIAPPRLSHLSFPPPGPVSYPRATKLFASDIGSLQATLNAAINPENKATVYHLEYISDADYIAAGETFGAGTITTPEAELPADFALHDVEVEVTELFPETVYHFRTVATNADGGPNPGPTASFETKEPIEFGAYWSTEVGTDRAVVHAEANPFGLAATGRFQYVDQASFEESEFTEAMEAPAPTAEPLDFGSGEAMVERSAELFSLAPGTTYSYRLLLEARCEPEPAPLCQYPGPVGTFNTFPAPSGKVTGCANDEFRLGAAGFLPDCRAYEMVSPTDKHGAGVEVVANIGGAPAGLDQVAADGNSISYSTYKAFGQVASAPYSNQYLARRGAGGWASEGISPPREGPSIMTYQSANLDRQFKLFSEDLCEGWVVQDANPTLAEGAIAEYGGLYLRENCGAGLGSYEAFSRLEPPQGDPEVEPRQFIPELQGASTDGDVAVFRVAAALTDDAPPQPAECSKSFSCVERVYEATADEVKPVCVLPDESAFEGGPCSVGTFTSASLGERTSSVGHAVSADGSRIFWSPSDNLVSGGPLFVRIDGSETIQVTTEPARFRTAAVDGSKVIYTINQDLFEFDVDSKTETPIAGAVQGVAGGSDDASRVYLTSKEALAGGAVEGESNLYLYEVGSGFRYIATLLAADVLPGADPVDIKPSRRLSRVTPDGDHLIFMWGGDLTGYDNTDAASGEGDQEVFLYDSTAAGGEGELRCLSCNPTGARPAGREIGRPGLEKAWAAAWFPTWESQFHGQRILSDDGQRVVFNSFEALVPRDVNGQQDVYQWEAVGAGSCTVGDPGFNESAAGCLALISTGQSPQGSEIVEISADGDDVFFKTGASLVSSDTDLVDIYDARVGGGFPEPESPPAQCEGEACQNPAAAPEAETPSSTNVGPGNPPYVKKSRGRSCPKGKRKVKRKGKVRCVPKKVHRKRHRHNRVDRARRVAR